MKVKAGDVIRCVKCNHVHEVRRVWLLAYGNEISDEDFLISDDRLRCSQCMTKGGASKSKLTEEEAEIFREFRYMEIREHVDRYGGDPDSYTRITTSAWWSSDEANYEDVLLRAREEDIERNRKADRE